ncbi:hypothetical protein P170DRAFT_75725 [Aspergillus steynii IBT 23096]|uniref:Uncharacterized protein n=1 Tax=Aspergillus steynii IBT 23096 TaxID=1392250 RepID=A0A2I2FRQ3_9EURO|nr:uncharacterized protein P170DRAFT_75725 [Aspergillus steynii IBT 23096]PLB43318.1 hypothetical protein P170DRAFT_75725 [Aspergillus steynii IBT 23096]
MHSTLNSPQNIRILPQHLQRQITASLPPRIFSHYLHATTQPTYRNPPDPHPQETCILDQMSRPQNALLYLLPGRGISIGPLSVTTDPISSSSHRKRGFQLRGRGWRFVWSWHDSNLSRYHMLRRGIGVG